jgi:hypothetical protein
MGRLNVRRNSPLLLLCGHTFAMLTKLHEEFPVWCAWYASAATSAKRPPGTLEQARAMPSDSADEQAITPTGVEALLSDVVAEDSHASIPLENKL